MNVFRFENYAGMGPYMECNHPGFRVTHFCDSQPAPRFASPVARELLERGKLLFGFSSVRQITDWWHRRQIEAMAETGFYLTVWNVPDNAVWADVCGKQVAFRSDVDKELLLRRPVLQIKPEELQCDTFLLEHSPWPWPASRRTRSGRLSASKRGRPTQVWYI